MTLSLRAVGFVLFGVIRVCALATKQRRPQQTDDARLFHASDRRPMRGELLEAERVGSIIGAFFEVYNYFGYGLSEGVYAAALVYALEARGHQVVRELRVPIYFKERLCAWQRLDMIGVLLHFGPKPIFHRYIDWPKRRPGQPDSCRGPISTDRDANSGSSDVTLVERNVPDGGPRLGTLGKFEHGSAAPGLAPSTNGASDAHERVGVDVDDAAQVQPHGEHLRP